MNTIITLKANDLMTVEQFAEALGRPRVTVYRWITKGRISAIRIGKVIYIPTTELQKVS